MSKLTLIGTFCVLIAAAIGKPLDQSDQLNVNVKVDVGPKTRSQKLQEEVEKVNKEVQNTIGLLKTQVAEDSTLAQKLQGLAEKAKRGFSAIESDMKELVEEAKKDPELDKFIEPLIWPLTKMLILEIGRRDEENNSRND